MGEIEVDNLNIRNSNFLCGVVEGFYGRPWTTEQRKEIFRRMNKMNLNAYLYAPKDDYKHRAYWRDLYSVEEAEHLTSLIEAAKDNNITFYYALSPGLDITYSSTKEVICLKRKLEQVAQFGCSAFALLFDDIEPDMCEADKEIFQSFAHAQVSVTNEVYQHLGQPKFLFCPTEYCATRSVPNVQNSEYLNTIGNKLLPDIDIMWTGPKVISKVITVKSLEELSKVLRRPPVIWDNIHANDYDQKRLFLGPYDGRSPDIIPHVHGVLTNPNCEFEANFIAMHTLAQWSRCNVDGKKDLTLNDSVTADIKLETESEDGSVEDIPSQLNPNTYHPKKALRAAINDWLPEFHKYQMVFGHLPKSLSPPVELIQSVNSCLTVSSNIPNPPTSLNAVKSLKAAGINNANQLQVLAEIANNSSYQPHITPINSFVPIEPIESSAEPMDCVSTPGASPKLDSKMSKLDDELENETILNNEKSKVEEGVKMQTDSDSKLDDDKLMTYEDLTLLVDLFYTPFEHGTQAIHLLQEFHWLKTNAHIISQSRKTKSPEPQVQEWHERVAKFDEHYQAVCRMFIRLTNCPNRAIVYDLYSYMSDMKVILSLLMAFVKWLACGHVTNSSSASSLQGGVSWCSKGYKEAFMSGDQEPWVFRGGLAAEFQRMLPLEGANDLFIYRLPETPSSKVYTIRPYLPIDETAVYDICKKTCCEMMDCSADFESHPDLIGDKFIGGFITLSPEYCFVVEDEDGVCGYAVAALDTKQYYQKLEAAWTPEMCLKYQEPRITRGKTLTPAQAMISSFHNKKLTLPDSLHSRYPSLLKMNILPSVVDASIPKRLLSCLLAALKANGSHGIHSLVGSHDKQLIDMYTKLSFFEVPLTEQILDDTMVLGRAI